MRGLNQPFQRYFNDPKYEVIGTIPSESVKKMSFASCPLPASYCQRRNRESGSRQPTWTRHCRRFLQLRFVRSCSASAGTVLELVAVGVEQELSKS